jgi:hypothetical protein
MFRGAKATARQSSSRFSAITAFFPDGMTLAVARSRAIVRSLARPMRRGPSVSEFERLRGDFDRLVECSLASEPPS